MSSLGPEVNVQCADATQVEDDSLAFSLTSSEIGTAVSDRLVGVLP